MSIELITLLLFVTFMILLSTGLAIAWVMGATAVIFGVILFGPSVMVIMVSRVYSLMFNYALIAVPLFIFMGNILQKSGVAEQLFNAIYVWFGGLRGGLAVASIIACAIMAAMVGVVGAEIVTIGLIGLPAMLAKGYDKKLALGSIAAGGGLASLIPPSVVFILYGMICGVSIGELYIAGVVPGLLVSALFIAYILIRSWLNPDLAPAASLKERDISFKQKLLLLKGLILPLLLILVVLGSIYAGVATATEAGGLGCVGALICGMINRRFRFEDFKLSLYSTITVSSMIVWLLFGSQTIIGVYSLSGGDEFVKNSLIGLNLGKWGTIILMQIILIGLGCLIDWIGILMLTMPLFIPILKIMEVDLIWFGVIFALNMQISYISPPFGPACFYLKSVVPKNISLENIYSSIWPFLLLNVLALALVLLFPNLALYLPGQMIGR
jgi:tripartite ATP-independent transporter DctM subunit